MWCSAMLPQQLQSPKPERPHRILWERQPNQSFHAIPKLQLTPSQADFEALFTHTQRQSHSWTRVMVRPTYRTLSCSFLKLFLSASLKKLGIYILEYLKAKQYQTWTVPPPTGAGRDPTDSKYCNIHCQSLQFAWYTWLPTTKLKLSDISQRKKAELFL